MSEQAASKSFTEHDLYPILSDFLYYGYGIYSKRIDELRSSNNRAPRSNRWLHPDVVGMEPLDEDWSQAIKDCVKEHKDKQVKLWSFEVKLEVKQSNIREVFFQTVSNSSWANYGYLAAAQLHPHALKELHMLSSLHGIGFIRLNTEDLTESETMIPAQERGVDWETANRLERENGDFKEYISKIKEFYQAGVINPTDWDAKIIEDDSPRKDLSETPVRFKINRTDKIYVLVSENPRKPDTHGWHAFNILLNGEKGMSVEDYLDNGGGWNHLRHDIAKKFIEIR